MSTNNESITVNGETKSHLRQLLANILNNQKAVEVLKQRAQALAVQEEEAEDKNKKSTYLCFSLSQELYCLPVEAVVEIQPAGRITPIPHTPPWYAGIVNIRGSILPVISLAELIGLKAEASSKSQMVIVSYKNYKLCFLTGAVKGLKEIDHSELKIEASLTNMVNNEFIRGIANSQFIVLDIEALLRSQKLIVKEEV
jgi:purine-binding chemotaxis protein CheW